VAISKVVIRYGAAAMILPTLKHALDALASAAGVACAMLSAANVITLLIITYWTLRIYELPVVQGWLRRKPPVETGGQHGTD